MSIPELVGKAQTVLGPIDGNDMGMTLAHEHVLMDGSALYAEPAESSDKGKAFRPVKLM